MSQDYFMGQDMQYPGRLITSRVQAINNEITKQRQLLPHFRNPYQNTTAHGLYKTAPQNASTQRTEQNRSSLYTKSPNIYRIGPKQSPPGAILASSRVLKNDSAFGSKLQGGIYKLNQRAETESYEASSKGPVTYENSQPQTFAVVARHHTQSTDGNMTPADTLEANCLSLESSNNIKGDIQKLHQQQRLQMQYMEQMSREINQAGSREASIQHLNQKMPINSKKRSKNPLVDRNSLEEDKIYGGDDDIVRHAEGGLNMPTSLGILRNMAAQNRPNLPDLDVDYRIRAEGLVFSHGSVTAHKNTSQRSSKISSDMQQPNAQSSTMRQTAFNPNFQQQKLRRGLQTVGQQFERENEAVDLDEQATSDINKFMKDQFELSSIQRTPILKNDTKNYLKEFNDYQRGSVFSSGNRHLKQHQVKIIDDETNANKYATPVIKLNQFQQNQQQIIADSYDIMAGNPKTPVGYYQMSKTGMSFQNTPLASRNDLSPPIYNNKTKFLNQKLPSINRQTVRNSQNTRLRNLKSNSNQGGSPAYVHPLDSANSYMMMESGVPTSLPPYQLKLNKKQNDRSGSQYQVKPKQRSYEQIVRDLEKQLGFTHEENQAARKKAKELKALSKKYSSRKDNDIIAKNKDYVKNLSECNNLVPGQSSQKLQNLQQKYSNLNEMPQSTSKTQAQAGSRGTNNSKLKRQSPRTAKVSPRKHNRSKNNIRDLPQDHGTESQINILIPLEGRSGGPRHSIAKDNSENMPAEDGGSFKQNLKLFARHQSPSLRKMSKGSRAGSHDHSGDAYKYSSQKSNKSPGVKSKKSAKSGKSGYQSMDQGSSPNQESRQRHKPNNLYDFDPKFFHKKNSKPTLIQVEVKQEDLEHLKTDDIDEVSKLEVTYKILKEQLRHHQKQLIKKKEELKQKVEQGKVAEMKGKPLQQTVDLHKFAKHIKHFETYGSQRDVSPEIRRIVKNLMCQKHSFMYCPKCKTYDQMAVDPIENIQKFMRFVKDEQEKLRVDKAKKTAIKKKNRQGKNKPLPYDSASEITDLEEEGILNKYYEDRMTDKQRKVKERKLIQERLYGLGNKIAEHVCKSSQGRPNSAQATKLVKMELREIEDPVSMVDQSNSAHQFSLQDHSVQADSEARNDRGMQTSAIDKQSQGYQYSRQDMESKANQCSEIDYLSNQMNTSVYPPGCGKEHMAIQTEVRRGTPAKVSKNVQTIRPKDDYKDDWEISQVYRKALKLEAEKRCITFVDPVPDGEKEDDEEDSTHDDPFKTQLNSGTNFRTREKQQERLKKNVIAEQGSQTDAASSSQNDGVYSALGILKNYKQKGNIKQLTESEIQYVKKLLKQKQHGYWSEESTLVDLHRHCKYTIRKLTQQMANIDNYGVFKHLRDPTREHTLYLVYRAELLQAALGDSQKIFKLLTATIYDGDEVQRIIDEKSFSMEDISFLRKRVTMFKRILTQANAFLETYKLFNNQFTFKKMPLKDYVTNMSMQTQQALVQIEDLRAANPKEASQEDERMKKHMNKKREEFMARQKEIEQARRKVEETQQKDQAQVDKSPENQNMAIDQDSSVEEQPVNLNGVFDGKRGSIQIAGQDQVEAMDIGLSKYAELECVNRETIDLINQEIASQSY